MTDDEPPTGRRPRFSREGGQQVRLTLDDLGIIHHVARHRFLRSTHLVRLLPHRSPKKLIERIGALYHAGYLDRPRAQLDYYATTGSAPLVYALGDRSREVDPEFGNVSWTQKNREVHRPYIEHALLIADVMVGIELAVRAHNDLQLLRETALLRLRPPTSRGESWSLSADIAQRSHQHSLSVLPDAVFALRHKATGACSYFFLEADRGKMTVSASDLGQSSFRRKLLCYNAALKARQHVERFGFENARVLTVTTSDERVSSMIAAVNEVTRGAPSGRFLFADWPSLEHADPLTFLWRTNASKVQLAPSSNVVGQHSAVHKAA